MSERLQIGNPDQAGRTRSRAIHSTTALTQTKFAVGSRLEAIPERRAESRSRYCSRGGVEEKGEFLLDARQHHERSGG